jgi:putative ABC transport system permease protein
MRDIRYGLRTLRRNPIMTVVAVLSLAMGIRATAAVFGLIDAVVLKPLPVSKPNRLVTPSLILHQGAFDNFSYAQFEAFRNAPAFSSLCAWSADRFDAQWSGRSESLLGQYVSPGYFETWGISPAIGNFPEATQAAQASSIVASYAFWESRFNGSGARVVFPHCPQTTFGN